MDIVNAQAVNTSTAYKGYHGYVTVTNANESVTISGLIRSKLKDGTYSYRTITGIWDGTKWIGTASYLIKDQFNPGYYWSSEKTDDNTPIFPTYIGTTIQNYTISEQIPYIWYTNDGNTWTLLYYYINPESAKLYIASTLMAPHLNSDGTTTNWMGGFIAYCKANGDSYTVAENDYIVGNFIPAINELSEIDLSKLPRLTADAIPGYIPNIIGYKYIWSIKGDATDSEKTDINNWTLESSFGTISGLNHMNIGENSGTTNACVISNHRWVKYDPNTKIVTEWLYPTSTGVEYWSDIQGTPDNWQNSTWRKYFLMNILRRWLDLNIQFYDTKWGFTFNWSGESSCFNISGYTNIATGEITTPSSDADDNDSFIPTSKLWLLTGEVCDYGYKANFYFKNLELGKIMENVGLANQNSEIEKGTIVETTAYDIKEADDYAIIVTDMKTGKQYFISSNGTVTK